MSIGLMLSAANPGLLAMGSSSSYGESDYNRRLRLQRMRDTEDQRRAFSYEEGDYDDDSVARGRYCAPHKRIRQPRATTENALRAARDRAAQARVESLPPYEWRNPITSKERERRDALYERYTAPAVLADYMRRRRENAEKEAEIIAKMSRKDEREDWIIAGVLAGAAVAVVVGIVVALVVFS